jgi:hypothetical protein
MTMHNEPFDHLTEREDAALDATLKIGGMVVALVVMAVAVLWLSAA